MADQDVLFDLLSSSIEYLAIVQKDRIWSDGLHLGADLGCSAFLRAAMSSVGCLLPSGGPSKCAVYPHGSNAVLPCKHGELKQYPEKLPARLGVLIASHLIERLD